MLINIQMLSYKLLSIKALNKVWVIIVTHLDFNDQFKIMNELANWSMKKVSFEFKRLLVQNIYKSK